MDTRAIALTIVFSALAIALTPIAIPAGFLLGYSYRFWEIPIVVAFLLFGPKIGIAVTVIRTIAEMTILLRPSGFVGPITALGGTLAMLLGVYLASWLLKRGFPTAEGKRFGVAAVTLFAALGALFRASIAPLVMYPVYRFFLPRAFTDAEIVVLVPGIMLFAATLAIYTVIVGYLVARVISRNLRVGNGL